MGKNIELCIIGYRENPTFKKEFKNFWDNWSDRPKNVSICFRNSWGAHFRCDVRKLKFNTPWWKQYITIVSNLPLDEV